MWDVNATSTTGTASAITTTTTRTSSTAKSQKTYDNNNNENMYQGSSQRSYAYNQNNPNNWVNTADVNGVHSTTADQLLRSKNFKMVFSCGGGNECFQWWYNYTSRQCIQLTIYANQVQSARKSHNEHCR